MIDLDEIREEFICDKFGEPDPQISYIYDDYMDGVYDVLQFIKTYLEKHDDRVAEA